MSDIAKLRAEIEALPSDKPISAYLEGRVVERAAVLEAIDRWATGQPPTFDVDAEIRAGRVHGYTCGDCSWGRLHGHTRQEYFAHREAAHWPVKP